MRKLKVTTIEELLALPDEEIDLATAALLLAKQWDSTVDIDRYRAQVNGMAESLRPALAKKQTPDAIIKAINECVFEELGYDVPQSADSTPILQDTDEVDEKLFLLHFVLDTKVGNCVGLSTLYLSLSERLDLPIYGVSVPGHIFIRYDDGVTKINIETVRRGKSYADSAYVEEFGVSAGTPYLINLSKRQVVGRLLSDLGVVNLKQGELEEATAKLKTSIRINPKDAEAHLNLGSVYRAQGNVDETMTEWRIAIKIDPNMYRAHHNIAHIYADRGKFGEAIAEFKIAARIAPRDVQAHLDLGALYKDLGRSHEATAEWRTAIKINPKHTGAYNSVGVFCLEQGDVNGAITAFREAININPGYAEAHIGLGSVYLVQGNLKEAMAECKSAINIDSALPQAHLCLGFIYKEQDNNERAIAHLEEFINLANADPDWQSVVAEAQEIIRELKGRRQ